jgi:hypothetical protein
VEIVHHVERFYGSVATAKVDVRVVAGGETNCALTLRAEQLRRLLVRGAKSPITPGAGVKVAVAASPQLESRDVHVASVTPSLHRAGRHAAC